MIIIRRFAYARCRRAFMMLRILIGYRRKA